MARIVIITPNPLLDCLHDGSITPGTVTRSDGLQLLAGGKGLNVGRVLVAHGHEVIAGGFAGGWTGDAFRRIVRDEGQHDDFIQCQARLRLGFLTRDCAGAGSTALLENGFAVSDDEQQLLLRRLQNRLDHVDLCIVSGSVPDAACTELFCGIAVHCREAGVPCWIDSYGPAMDTVLRSDCLPQLAKPNREEFSSSEHWQRLAECHITDGGAGISVRHGSDRFDVTPPQVSCVNPIGSGDAYIAGLAHARLSGLDLQQQLRYASAAGAVNASRMSVADMSPQDIEALVEQVSVSSV